MMRQNLPHIVLFVFIPCVWTDFEPKFVQPVDLSESITLAVDKH